MPPALTQTYGSVGPLSSSPERSPYFNRHLTHAWPVHGDYEPTVNSDDSDKGKDDRHSHRDNAPSLPSLVHGVGAAGTWGTVCSLASVRAMAYYLVYAVVNVIISVPSMYGYAAVIFNHPVFAPHMNELSKLVIFSSLMHQLAFTSFSSLGTFAIGTVQDAGLIFLSSMANHIAGIIIDREGGTEQEVVSTVLVLLSMGTATLGLVLIAMGHFRFAEYVTLDACRLQASIAHVVLQSYNFLCVFFWVAQRRLVLANARRGWVFGVYRVFLFGGRCRLSDIRIHVNFRRLGASSQARNIAVGHSGPYRRLCFDVAVSKGQQRCSSTASDGRHTWSLLFRHFCVRCWYAGRPRSRLRWRYVDSEATVRQQ